MENPYVHLLSSVEWQFWCTLSFKKLVPNYVHGSMYLRWLRGLERWTRTRPKRLLWVCRRELGEMGSRLHLHALVAGVPKSWVHRGTVFALKNEWESCGGGNARVFLYESGLTALEYMCTVSERDAAQHYEAQKFGNNATVILSEGLIRFVSHKRRRGMHETRNEEGCPVNSGRTHVVAQARG